MGDNPTISLMVFLYFLSAEVSSIKSELVQEQEPKLGTPNFCINKWRHPWDHTLRTQDSNDEEQELRTADSAVGENSG